MQTKHEEKSPDLVWLGLVTTFPPCPWVCAPVCLCVCRAQYLEPSFVALHFFEPGSLSEPGAHYVCPTWLRLQAIEFLGSTCLCSLQNAWGCCTDLYLAFMSVPEAQIQVFVIPQEACYPRIHLPSLGLTV